MDGYGIVNNDYRIRAVRQFVDWLDASDATKWEAPRRWEKLFSVGCPQLPAGHARKGASGDEVRTFSVDELQTSGHPLNEPVTGDQLFFLLS